MSADPVAAALAAGRPAILERLIALLRIPSVSTDPAYLPHMAAARALLAERLRAGGLANVAELPTAGHAAIYGEWLGAGGDAPTLLVYGHYDVQPPDPEAAWTTPPFAPTVRDGRLYARGAADDKGPLSVALEAILAMLRVEGRLPVNLKLLLEGEEEIGSRHIGDLATEHRARLAADVVLSADGARWRADLPTVNVASRGICNLEVTARTASKDLHSGRYGGAVANAALGLARLLAGLHDRAGRVAVPGFYDGVAEPTPEERRTIAQIPFDEAGFLAGIGAAAAGEGGYGTLERLWLRPTLDVTGMGSGYQGPGSKTAIPHEARAKLSARLVPGQDPERVRAAIAAHLRRAAPAGVAIEVAGAAHGSPAYRLPLDHPALAAVEATLTARHGRPPLRVRIGATLPISAVFRAALGIDTVMLSFATADEDFHAPNEFFRLSALEEGPLAWVDALRRIGAQGRAAYAPFRRIAARATEG